MGKGRVWGQSSLHTIGHQGRRPCSLGVRQLSKVVDVNVDHYHQVLNSKLCWVWQWSLTTGDILSQCSGEEERAQGWRVLFILLVVACIVGLAMIVVSSSQSSFEITPFPNCYLCMIMAINVSFNYIATCTKHLMTAIKEWMLVLYICNCWHNIWYICNCKCRDIYLHLA